ncbi:MAG: glycosyltransferase family 39 protein [Candidatus Methylomirabilis sp.]|nr:glycosyltransferase family 39 protein [Deltaproteobacteria bacterium]
MSAQSVQRLLFFAILVLGTSLRMWQITDRGPYLYDDAVFHAEARWMDDVWKGVKRSLAVKMEEARTGEDLWKFDAEVHQVFGLAQGRAPQFGRPGMDLLIFLMMRVTGSVPYAGPLVSATLGSLALVLIYGVASRLFGGRAGLLAMLFAAVNGFEIFYDRTGLGETSSTFFVLLGLYAQVRAFQAKDAREQLWMIGAGLAWGAAVLTHSRILIQVAIPVFVEVGAWLLWRERRWPEKAARAVAFGLAFLIPLLAMELPYYFSVLIANAWDFPVTWRTYLQVLARHVMIGAAAVSMPEGAGPTWNALLFPYAFWLASGPVFMLAAIGGAAVALRRRALGDGMLLVWIAVPLAVALGAIPRPRYISIALPAFAILAAVGVDWLWEWAGRNDAAPGSRRPLARGLGDRLEPRRLPRGDGVARLPGRAPHPVPAADRRGLSRRHGARSRTRVRAGGGPAALRGEGIPLLGGRHLRGDLPRPAGVRPALRHRPRRAGEGRAPGRPLRAHRRPPQDAAGLHRPESLRGESLGRDGDGLEPAARTRVRARRRSEARRDSHLRSEGVF